MYIILVSKLKLSLRAPFVFSYNLFDRWTENVRPLYVHFFLSALSFDCDRNIFMIFKNYYRTIVERKELLYFVYGEKIDWVQGPSSFFFNFNFCLKNKTKMCSLLFTFAGNCFETCSFLSIFQTHAQRGIFVCKPNYV